MIRIYAPTERQEEIKTALLGHTGLLDEVSLLTDEAPIPDGRSIVLENGNILQPPNWFNTAAPVLLPHLPYAPDTLAGMVLVLLHRYDEALPVLGNYPQLWLALEYYTAVANGYEIRKNIPQPLEDFKGWFNYALGLQYGVHESLPNVHDINLAYEKALGMPVHQEGLAFAVKHYCIFLNDAEQPAQAAMKAADMLEKEGLTVHAANELKWVRCQSWLSMLEPPYDEMMLTQLKQDLWEVLAYFESYERTTDEALLLVDATLVATISESFAEALGYINKAIQILQAADQPEMVANAQLRKGILLFTWAHKGQAQFFRPAKDAFLEALKVFTREDAPHSFADIHHYLGIIYSEIPDEVQKKSVWAGVSASSFHEALAFYNKVEYPYEFAQICNHFGNAFTKYPAAALGDNFEKALNWYREALDVRTGEHYALERCLTLSNYLVTAWKAGNPGDGWNEDRWNDMWEKAQELKALATDENLHAEAEDWIDALVRVKADFKE
jgi:tetratricopeptide (TPR) repeat protein